MPVLKAKGLQTQHMGVRLVIACKVLIFHLRFQLLIRIKNCAIRFPETAIRKSRGG
jgi:hypothetical protein